MKDYFVLYRRDIQNEKSKKYGEKMLYDRLQQFASRENALRFTLSNLPAVLAKSLPVTGEEQIRNKDKPYLVAARFHGKYATSCMGETEYVTTFDALRCSEGDLEKAVEEFTSEKYFSGEIFVGLELNIFGGVK